MMDLGAPSDNLYPASNVVRPPDKPEYLPEPEICCLARFPSKAEPEIPEEYCNPPEENGELYVCAETRLTLQVSKKPKHSFLPNERTISENILILNAALSQFGRSLVPYTRL